MRDKSKNRFVVITVLANRKLGAIIKVRLNMNKKKLFLKLLIIVVGISSTFLLSSCFPAIGLVSCGRNCKESCKSNDDFIDGNEYGIYYTLSADGDSYFVSEVGYKEYNVKIPESYNGKPVTGIMSGAFTHYKAA